MEPSGFGVACKICRGVTGEFVHLDLGAGSLFCLWESMLGTFDCVSDSSLFCWLWGCGSNPHNLHAPVKEHELAASMSTPTAADPCRRLPHLLKWDDLASYLVFHPAPTHTLVSKRHLARNIHLASTFGSPKRGSPKRTGTRIWFQQQLPL